MKYDVHDMYDWPLVPKAGVIFLVCIILFYLIYFLDFSDFSGLLKRLAQQESDLKMQITALSGDINNIKIELSEYPKLTTALKDTQQKMISPKELPELLNEILKVGRQNELEFNQFNPGPEVKAGEYTKVSIRTIVLGTYDQIANFISQVANMDKTVSIANFTIGKQPKLNQSGEALPDFRLLADITLDVYEVKRP